MRIHHLPAPAHKRKKRVGRGNASGRGTYSTRGVKGQKARAGARIRPGFEGGQTPLFARIPKRRGGGATNPRPFPVNVDMLEKLFAGGATVDLHSLKAAGVAYGAHGVKILGDGELTKSLTVKLPTSAPAKEKIEKAGGRVIVK